VCNRNSYSPVVEALVKLGGQGQEARDWLRSEAAHRERLNTARRDIFQSGIHAAQCQKKA
jgi:hypothetical protein